MEPRSYAGDLLVLRDGLEVYGLEASSDFPRNSARILQNPFVSSSHSINLSIH